MMTTVNTEARYLLTRFNRSLIPRGTDYRRSSPIQHIIALIKVTSYNGSQPAVTGSYSLSLC